MKKTICVIVVCCLASLAYADTNLSLCVAYYFRDNPKSAKWYAAPAPSRPYEVIGNEITRWDVSQLGARPPMSSFVASNTLAVAWWSDYQRTHKADLQDEVEKAVVLVILDDRNATAQEVTRWVTAMTNAVAQATSLANYQTRVAAIPPLNLPQRTPEQIKAAIKEKLAP